MSKTKGYPHLQPFCINGKKNLTIKYGEGEDK